MVTEHGKRKRLTKRTVICRQLANRSAAGDLAALRLLLPLITQAEAAETSATTAEAPLDPELERTLTRALFARLASLEEPPEQENQS